jgi:hypothetical protein
MKILIDADLLCEQGVISAEMAVLLKSHARRDIGGNAINILVAFGSIAVAAGLVGLMASAGFSLMASIALAALFGMITIGVGWLTLKFHEENWGLLGRIWMVVGALVLAASGGLFGLRPLNACILAAVIFTGTGIVAQSGLLIALVPLTLEAAFGGSTGYWAGCYEISIRSPTLTILVFTALAFGVWRLALLLPRAGERVALIFVLISLVLVNIGFWIGSLFGDDFNFRTDALNDGINTSSFMLPTVAFVIVWAVSLFLTGLWAARRGYRRLVNLVAVFGAIEFYTQWYERLGAEPLSMVVGGVTAIAFGYTLWRYNRY